MSFRKLGSHAEVFDEIGHVNLGNHTVMVLVVDAEELVEAVHAEEAVSLGHEHLVDEVGRLDLVQLASIVLVVLGPQLVNELVDFVEVVLASLDVLLFFNLLVSVLSDDELVNHLGINDVLSAGVGQVIAQQ